VFRAERKTPGDATLSVLSRRSPHVVGSLSLRGN
jgi:hypothetical protein